MTHKHWRTVAILGGLALGFFASAWPKGRNWGAATYNSGFNMADPTGIGDVATGGPML